VATVVVNVVVDVRPVQAAAIANALAVAKVVLDVAIAQKLMTQHNILKNCLSYGATF